jgi:uncharacterized protein YdeI (BOF family)
MNRWLLVGVLAAFLAGCSERTPKTLGAAVEGAAALIAAAQHTNLESSLVLQGTMTKKCPVAGCWFILQDESGTIKVDTKNAGFVVVDVPLNTRMEVAGRVTTNGSERLIDATGLRY